MNEANFIVRAYGIYLDDKQRVLLSDEFVFDTEMTKFPGGGLEFGEGLMQCVEREFLEETGLRFEVLDHFYTTDFFMESAFHEKAQIISVYYFVEPREKDKFFAGEVKQNLAKQAGVREQKFRWAHLKTLKKEDLSFPIDQHVALMLINRFCSE